MLVEEQGEKDRLRTFEQVGDEYFEEKMKRSPGYKQRLQQLLRDNVLSKKHKLTTAGETKMINVGTLPIQRVTRKIILEDCEFKEFWNTQNPSARDLRLLLHKMYGYAREMAITSATARWRGRVGLSMCCPRRVKSISQSTTRDCRTRMRHGFCKNIYGRSAIVEDSRAVSAPMADRLSPIWSSCCC